MADHQVVDTEEYEDEYDPDEEEDEGTSSSTSSFGRSYEELPDGFVTAGGFAKVLKEMRGVDVRPQVIYAAAKSSKQFPARRHSDGRIIVPIDGGLEWWDNKESRGGAGRPRSTEPTAWEKANASS